MAQNHDLPQPDDGSLALKLLYGQPLKWHEVWVQVIAQPDVQVYRALLGDPGVSGLRTYTWLLVGSTLAFIIQFFISKTFNVNFTQEIYSGLPVLALFLCAPAAGVAAVTGGTVVTGIQHITALLLGGTGDYPDLIYLYAAFTVPLLLIYSVLAVVPCLTWVIIPYALALNVIAVEAVYDFGWTKAMIAVFWLVPVGVVCAFIMALLATLLAG